MLWQWTLFLLLTVYMPYRLLTGSSSAASSSTSALGLASVTSSLITPLLPLALPIVLLNRMSSKFRYYYRFGLYCTTLGLTSVWAVLLSLAMSLAGNNSSIQHYVARSFYYFASPIVGWTLKVEGEEHLKTDRPVVLIGNHQSMIDILYLGRIFPKRTSVMAKRELKWTPFLGQFMSLSNAVFVDRKNRTDALATFARAAQFMKSNRMNIFIFAEGTRTNRSEASMLPFKKGAFHLAVQGQFDIVPIVMENYHHLYDGRGKRFEKGELTIRVLPPVKTQGKTSSHEDIEKLVEEARTKMLATLEELHEKRHGAAKKRLV